MFKHVDHGIELSDIECDTTPTGRYYYPPTGEKLPSVTTVLGATADKQGLDEWRSRVGDEEADRVSRRATVRGTAVHELAERYLNNEHDWNRGLMPVNYMSFKPIKRLLDERVNDVWFQEAPLYSLKLRTAGRVDLIAEYEGRLSIIDFKTGNKRKPREWITDYFLQESFYSAALYEMTGVKATQLVTVFTVDDELEPVVHVERARDWLPLFTERRRMYHRIKGI